MATDLIHPYTCTFYYPFDSTLATSTASVKLKAPERGDTRTKGRNQNFARTKNGQIVVYDMGTNLSEMVKISFEEVVQSEYAALIVFLDYVTWGGNKIKYVDYKGDEYIVRVYRNTVSATNKGESRFSNTDTTLYDFELELVDLTNNPIDNGATSVPSQLALHLADFNHPHNPKVTTTVVPGDGTKVIESVSVDNFKHVTWLVSLSLSNTYSSTRLIHATHNGAAAADATTVGTTAETIAETGTVPVDITLSVALSGSGATQVMSLRCAKAANSVDVAIRRLKV